jgi:hypothetical protein
MADPAETIAGSEVCPQHRHYTRAECQVGKTDDSGRNARAAGLVLMRRCHAVHVLGFADRPQFDRACAAVMLDALDMNGRNDAVSAANVGQVLVEQVAAVRVFPEVVMRIAYRKVRLERCLARAIEPFRAVGHRQP